MNHDYKKHLLIMLACCFVPLGAILAVSVFGLSLGALSGLLPYALVLLCPLMMIFTPHPRVGAGVMRGMVHNHSTAPHPTKTQTTVSDETIARP